MQKTNASNLETWRCQNLLDLISVSLNKTENITHLCLDCQSPLAMIAPCFPDSYTRDPMKFAEDHNSSKYKITGYDINGSEKGVEINGRTFTQSFILSPMELISDWQPQDLSSLTIEHFADLYEMKPEVIILGTGQIQTFPDRDILKYLVQNRIGYEIMDTQAACRTFNVIMAEGRNVVAGMFI